MEEIVIGEYSFTRKKIGRGAFSNIYLGKNQFTQRPVAIKEISFEQIDKIKQNIKREFSLLKKLKHKNIIGLHDVYFDNIGKNIFLVLDYHKRGDLAKFLKGKALKEKYAKKYMRQIADGLCYLYKNKILHRDLKLQNILVTDSLDIVITDFGFARYFENDTMIQTICGSPMYMAPEMILKKKYNNKSDLWSVGIILYELLTGDVPFKVKNMVELIQTIQKVKITLPLKYDTMLSSSCKELLFQLLKKNPDERISWEDFFTHKWFDVDEILQDENKLLEMSLRDMNEETLFKHRSIRESFNNTSSSLSGHSQSQIETNIIEPFFEMSMGGDSLDSSGNLDSTERETKDAQQLKDSFDSFKSMEMDDGEEKHNEHNRKQEQDIPNNLYDIAYPKKTTMPIPIYPNQSTLYITNDMIIDTNSNNLHEERTANSLSDSIKKYLMQSIHFFKESYQYISQNRTI